MPSYLPVAVIRSMTYAELERWWEVDFDVLASTAVAEATGEVHPTVAEALRSEDWLEQWADALYAATGELASSVERMEFLNDNRLKRTRRRAGLVEQRRAEANRLRRAQAAEQGWKMLPAHLKSSYTACLSLLYRHHFEEFSQLAAEETARRGLAPHSPFWGGPPYEDKFDAIEDGVARGLLQVPVTGEVEVALLRSDAQLTHLVAKDATSQEDRNVALRHPLMLRRWLGALEHLRDRHCELAGLEPAFTVSLPKLDMEYLAGLPVEEARGIINRRRFIRAVAQRQRECQMHAREAVRAVSVRREEVEQPWRECMDAAREELGRRHPDQLKALMAAFGPFCEPGSTDIRRDALGRGGAVPRDLIPLLKKALADGSWVELLKDAA